MLLSSESCKNKLHIYTQLQSSLGPDCTVRSHYFHRLDWTAVPKCQTVRSGPFYSLYFQARDRTVFSRPDRIFQTGLRSQLSGPCGPALSDGLQKRQRSGPDRTVASLHLTRCFSHFCWYFCIVHVSLGQPAQVLF